MGLGVIKMCSGTQEPQLCVGEQQPYACRGGLKSQYSTFGPTNIARLASVRSATVLHPGCGAHASSYWMSHFGDSNIWWYNPDYVTIDALIAAHNNGQLYIDRLVSPPVFPNPAVVERVARKIVPNPVLSWDVSGAQTIGSGSLSFVIFRTYISSPEHEPGAVSQLEIWNGCCSTAGTYYVTRLTENNRPHHLYKHVVDPSLNGKVASVSLQGSVSFSATLPVAVNTPAELQAALVARSFAINCDGGPFDLSPSNTVFGYAAGGSGGGFPAGAGFYAEHTEWVDTIDFRGQSVTSPANSSSAYGQYVHHTCSASGFALTNPTPGLGPCVLGANGTFVASVDFRSEWSLMAVWSES